MKEDLGKDRRSGNDRRVKDQPFMTERRYTDRRRVVSSFERDMLLSDSPVKTDEFTLLGVLADIRHKTGVGDKVMLSELADVLGNQAKVSMSILEIMKEYDRQLEEKGEVGTPGGLENMGDVWRLFKSWRAKLLP